MDKPFELASGAEEWRPIFGFHGYEVSSLGRVRSWRVSGRAQRFALSPRVLSPQPHKWGHLTVCLCRDADSEAVHQSVHRLVLEAFVGPCPEELECCHNNGDPSDNRLSNLRWDTPKANSADKTRHGTMLRGNAHWARAHPERVLVGEKCGSAKLTAEQAREIFVLRGNVSKRQIAKRFNVSPATVANIHKGLVWSHATGAPKRAKREQGR